jgi:hypothetical protein
MIRISDIYLTLLESKASESQGATMLKKGGLSDDEVQNIISDFAKNDKSKNQKNITMMSYLYLSGEKNTKNIIDVVNDYEDLLLKGRVKVAQPTKEGIKLGDKAFKDFIRFSEYIHGEKNKYGVKQKNDVFVANDFKAADKPIWSGNNIDIYDADSVGKCIKYTKGSLTGKSYEFCIGQFGNTMYKSHRDSKVSSFYFIVDRNRFKENKDGSPNLDDPLHIVVFDRAKNGIELTDANNDTGTISEFGTDVDKYVNYLKSKGVPVDKLVNRPKTDEEDWEEKLLGNKNKDLKWFMDLPVNYKSAYIGRGHLLTDDQFDYLIGEN